MTSRSIGYIPRAGDRIDIRVVGATVVDADTDDVYLAYRDSSTVCLPLDMPGLTITRARCRECRRPVSAGHKMDCSTGRAETRATEADRTTDVSLTSALAAAQEAYRRHQQAAPAGDEPLKTVTAADLAVGDIIKCGEEWLRITRTSRRSVPPERVTLNVETIPAMDYMLARPADPMVVSPIGLFDVYANHGSNAPTTKGQRIAAELHRLADRIATAGDDVPRPHVSLCCGYPRPSDVPAARARVDALAELLGMPPAIVCSCDTRHYDSKAAGDVRVWVYALLPDMPGTCTHCGQTCGCGGAA